MNVAAVIVNFRGSADTLECVRSLLSGKVCPARIIVVDNASEDGSWPQLLDAFPGVSSIAADATAEPIDTSPGHIVIRQHAYVSLTLRLAEANRGFGAGNNLGTSFLTEVGFHGYVWILNNDAFDVLGVLDALHRHALSTPLPEVFGTMLVECYDHDRIQACGGELRRPGLRPRHLHVGESMSRLSALQPIVHANYPVGASLFVHTGRYPVSSLFDERYFLFFEEPDLMARLGMNEVAIITCAAVAHRGGGSTGGGGHATRWTPLTDYHSIRSRILYARRLGGSQPAAALVVGLLIGLRRFWQGGMSVALNAWRGVLSGLRA